MTAIIKCFPLKLEKDKGNRCISVFFYEAYIMLQDNFKIETVNTTTKQNFVFNNSLHKKLKKSKQSFEANIETLKKLTTKINLYS